MYTNQQSLNLGAVWFLPVSAALKQGLPKYWRSIRTPWFCPRMGMESQLEAKILAWL
jgi:hypothetical protein